jgi:predicted nuclease of predicted toxin-antitoxin system
MSARARSLREKNVVIKLVKDLNKRMGDFESAVDELKILKESITEMHDEVTIMEDSNIASIGKLRADLKDNKTKILNDAAESVGKVIISSDELNELRDEVNKLKSNHKTSKLDLDNVITEKVEGLIQHRLALQELEHKATTASLQSSVENYKKEIENMNKSFDRMSGELDSQKKLTSSLALSGRQVSTSPVVSHTV